MGFNQPLLLGDVDLPIRIGLMQFVHGIPLRIAPQLLQPAFIDHRVRYIGMGHHYQGFHIDFSSQVSTGAS